MGKTKKMNIKTRKNREKEYEELYSNVSDDVYERISDHLEDKLTSDLLEAALDRMNEVNNLLEYHMIKFTFYEIPVQSHRPRVNFYTRNMHVPNAKDNHDAVGRLIGDIKENICLIDTPMKIILKAYYPMPNDIKPIDLILYEAEHQYAIGKPDFDNVLKAYCDMIQTHIILDDDIVSSCQFDKYFSLKPRVELSIIYMNGHTSEYVYKTIKSRKSYKDNRERIKSELLVTPYKKKRGKIK